MAFFREIFFALRKIPGQSLLSKVIYFVYWNPTESERTLIIININNTNLEQEIKAQELNPHRRIYFLLSKGNFLSDHLMQLHRQQTTTQSRMHLADKRISEQGSSTSKACTFQNARAGECTQITNAETTAWSQINTITLTITIQVLFSHKYLPKPVMK